MWKKKESVLFWVPIWSCFNCFWLLTVKENKSSLSIFSFLGEFFDAHRRENILSLSLSKLPWKEDHSFYLCSFCREYPSLFLAHCFFVIFLSFLNNSLGGFQACFSFWYFIPSLSLSLWGVCVCLTYGLNSSKPHKNPLYPCTISHPPLVLLCISTSPLTTPVLSNTLTTCGQFAIKPLRH